MSHENTQIIFEIVTRLIEILAERGIIEAAEVLELVIIAERRIH